ncbi:hypothetical protein LAZ67_13002826 [Cordylochernes scorpioides]|uniref:Uncharacterized protein n=1 Tax=Cordylochernes scorpioides TaxID=51811 RepID=A0ABY6L4S1_9ARAC|nr:hypothetical protein LAZ67_13002826 [Cordylochernes scorpioides]
MLCLGYTEGPVDGSLYATVAKKKAADALSDADGPHLSMDSGISSSSGPPQGSPSLTGTPTSERRQTRRLKITNYEKDTHNE